MITTGPSNYGVLLITLIGLATVVWAWRRFRRSSLIPGIKSVQTNRFWGSADLFFSMGKNTDAPLKIAKLVEKIGKVCQFYVFRDLFVLINDGKLAKSIFDRVRNKGSLLAPGLVEKNIFSLDTNDEWKRRRNKFRHAFTSAGLRIHETLFKSLILKFLGKIERMEEIYSVIKIDQMFSRFALNTIFTIGFEIEIDLINDGEQFNEINDAIQQYFKTLWVQMLPFSRTLLAMSDLVPFPKAIATYKVASGTLRKWTKQILQHLRTKHKEGSFSANSFGKLLMEFVDQEKPSERDLLSEIRLFLIAGYETTAHTLSWFVYSLCKNPEVQQKCQSVVDDWFTRHPNQCDSLSMLTPVPDYLEAVIKESMRKYPVAARGSARLVTDPTGFTIEVEPGKTVTIPTGTFILVSFYALHNDPDIWGADAADFNPDRWNCPSLSTPGAYAGTGVRPEEITFAPFSAGVRNCIGMNFALWEIRSLALNLVRRYSFEFVDDQLLREELAMITDVTMKPLNQLPIKVTKRNLG